MGVIINRLQYAVRHWWISLLLGALYLIVGIGVLFTPLASYVAISILFSISLVVGGILEIIFSVNNKNIIPGWGWYLAGGIIDLIIGIYLMAYPGLSMAVLPYVLAFWLIFRGVSIVGYSMDLKKYGARNWGWYIFFGILAFLCAVGIFWQPLVGAISIVYVVSFILIFVGVFRIILAFELRKLHKNIPEKININYQS